MKAISAVILSIMLFVSLALLPAISSAQNTGLNTYNNPNADTGPSLLNRSSNNKFDPMWLLPLLIVPVAYVIYKAANNDLTDDSRGFNSSSMIGAKGGKAKKRMEEESIDE
jgi:hypothetical protein